MLSRRGGRIRAPRRGLTRDDVDADESWATLDSAFREIHAKNASKLSFEQLFRSAYKLVLKKKGDFLFDKVKSFEAEMLDTKIRPSLQNYVTPSIEPIGPPDASRTFAQLRFLKGLDETYSDYVLCIGMIDDVLMYMKRVNTTEARQYSIYPVNLNLFRDRILFQPANDSFTSHTLISLLIHVIIDLIARERDKEQIDRPLIRGACRMLEQLHDQNHENDETRRLYSEQFEPAFLETSRVYYRQEGARLVAEKNASTFCSEARRNLQRESTLCQQALSVSTAPKIQAVVETELISNNIKAVIDFEGTGVNSMLDNDKVDDLANIYELVARIDSKLGPLKKAIHDKIQAIGNDINEAAVNVAAEKPAKPAPKQDGEKPPPERQINQQTLAAITWVENVLELKSKYDKLLERAFKSDAVMAKALEIAFQDFINKNSRSPEYLSLFLDEHLKKGNKNKTEAEIDHILDDGVTLLQYLADKDMLDTYYHKHMAKRLINKKSISRDVERQMLSRMKAKLGNQFTSKMEGLLKDTEVSESLNNQYKEHVTKLGDKDPDRIDIEASILTTTMWPVTQREGVGNCIYPTGVEHVRQAFEKFYLGKHQGRKLTWLAHMGDANIRATYKPANGKTRRYEIIAPTYCMVVLDLFNDNDRLTLEEIREITNIPDAKLRQALQSLAVAPKTRFLKKEPTTKEVNDGDVFTYNDAFQSPFVRIKVALVSETANRVETAEQRKETQKKADDQRGLEVDAAIVRIMKSRKTLSHQQLMTETIQILSARFQPDVAMIKKKIENLIEREYLERGDDPANPSYNYLA